MNKDWKNPNDNAWKRELLERTWPGIFTAPPGGRPKPMFWWFLIDSFEGERTLHDMGVIRDAFYRLPADELPLNADTEKFIQRLGHYRFREGQRCFIVVQDPFVVEHDGLLAFRLRGILRPLFLVTQGSPLGENPADKGKPADQRVDFIELSTIRVAQRGRGYELGPDTHSGDAHMTMVAPEGAEDTRPATRIEEMAAKPVMRQTKPTPPPAKTLHSVDIQPLKTDENIFNKAIDDDALFWRLALIVATVVCAVALTLFVAQH